jgi:hypothetical protein
MKETDICTIILCYWTVLLQQIADLGDEKMERATQSYDERDVVSLSWR